MNSFLHRLFFIVTLVSAPDFGLAMEIQWTRMTGQWPVEASPLVGPFGNTGTNNILILNRGGQLLLWSAEGTAIGSGQDGLVAQLPEDRWTTRPTLVESELGTQLIVVSVKGEVVCLDGNFQQLWRHKLAGETVWGRAVPAVVSTRSSPALVFSDLSGTTTCLTSTGGKIGWTNAFAAGPCKAPPKTFLLKDGGEGLLIPAGSTLFCCDSSGKARWRNDLGTEIVTRPEVLSLSDRVILCGTAAGSLFALSPDGKVLWERATGDTFSGWLSVLPRSDTEPLILFTGLWGNLHAVDVRGHRVWTHLFRSKTRGAPLVLDAADNGRSEIFIPTFHQHVYAFDEHGQFKDDIRLSGIMPSGLTPIERPVSDPPDVLVTTTTLLAYRLRPGPARSQYGPTPQPQNVTLEPRGTDESEEHVTVLVKNPAGSVINAHISITDTQGWTKIAGTLTARSAFELPPQGFVATNGGSFRATVRDVAGSLLAQTNWVAPSLLTEAERLPRARLTTWPAAPFGSFEATRIKPLTDETKPTKNGCVSLETLYLDEIDEAGFIIASALDQPTRFRVTLPRPAREDGVTFAGNIILREVIPTGSVNGEIVPDALPALGDAGLLSIQPSRSAKVWVSVDAHGAQPGNYTGHIAIAPLQAEVKRIELPLKIEVLNLRLPEKFPLTLCTWDYVPNRWFPSRTIEVLNDMGRHGVNVFPRNAIPPARSDSAGKLAIDWGPLDAELTRLEGRGTILFHLNHPPIEFATKRTEQEKRLSELDYIRSLRDHLKEHGRSYADYAFYLLDEPGLDYGTNVVVLLDAGKLFREADPKLLTYTDPVPGLSWKDFERIEPLVDVWAPNMRLVSGLLSGDPRIERIMKAKTVWSYECVAQVKSLSPLRYNRANAWRAKFFGLGGIGFWTHSTTEVDIWFAGKTDNDEFALVYPGELPVPSARWEAVRDGLEDVAAMELLEEQIRLHRHAGTMRELVQKAEETRTAALRDVMELSDQAFVESRDFLQKGDRVLAHTWTDVETYRRHRAEIARLTLALRAEASPK